MTERYKDFIQEEIDKIKPGIPIFTVEIAQLVTKNFGIDIAQAKKTI